MTASAPVRPSNAAALRSFLFVLVIVLLLVVVPMTSATMRGRPEIEPKSRQIPA